MRNKNKININNNNQFNQMKCNSQFQKPVKEKNGIIFPKKIQMNSL